MSYLSMTINPNPNSNPNPTPGNSDTETVAWLAGIPRCNPCKGCSSRHPILTSHVNMHVRQTGTWRRRLDKISYWIGGVVRRETQKVTRYRYRYAEGLKGCNAILLERGTEARRHGEKDLGRGSERRDELVSKKTNIVALSNEKCQIMIIMTQKQNFHVSILIR